MPFIMIMMVVLGEGSYYIISFAKPLLLSSSFDPARTGQPQSQCLMFEGHINDVSVSMASTGTIFGRLGSEKRGSITCCSASFTFRLIWSTKTTQASGHYI